MTSEEFVRRIRVAVYDSVVSGSLSLLQAPPGRKPRAELVRLSEWFNQLPDEEKERIASVIRLAARFAVFQMLTVIDGMKSIREEGEPLGKLELRYTVEGESVLLNGPKGEFLHDIFAGQVPPM